MSLHTDRFRAVIRPQKLRSRRIAANATALATVAENGTDAAGIPAVETFEVVLKKLDDLRSELTDLAFDLERRQQPEAADVATMIWTRVNEICGELAASARGDAGSLRFVKRSQTSGYVQ